MSSGAEPTRKAEYDVRIEQVIKQLERSQKLVSDSLKGVTQEESLVRAGGDGNHFNWLVGHLTVSRDGIAAALGGKGVVPEGVAAKYAPGAPHPAGEEEQLSVLAELYEAASHAATASLRDATDDQLEGPAPFGSNVIGFAEFVAWHDAYHTGQAAVYRRLMGHDGVIR